MQIVKDIFDEIKSTNSKLEKQRIIRENKDNKLFTETLEFLLSPYIVTGLSNKKIHKMVEPSSELAPYYLCQHSTFQDVINYLKQHNTGTDVDIYEIQSFLSNYEEDDRKFYEGLITKSLKLGCDAKTVNTVIPKLIPTFDVMLANKYFDKPERVVGEFTLTEKLDGFRLATVVHNDEIKFYSRQGQVVDGLIEIESDMIKFCRDNKIHNAFFDGELVA